MEKAIRGIQILGTGLHNVPATIWCKVWKTSKPFVAMKLLVLNLIIKERKEYNMKIPKIKYGKTKAIIVNEFLKTDAKIKKDNIKEPEKIIKLHYTLMYKCLGIIANEIDDFTLLIKETNNLLEQINKKL